MVHVQAIAQTRNARRDLVELDALLAPICVILAPAVAGFTVGCIHTTLPDVHGVGCAGLGLEDKEQWTRTRTADLVAMVNETRWEADPLLAYDSMSRGRGVKTTRKGCRLDSPWFLRWCFDCVVEDAKGRKRQVQCSLGRSFKPRGVDRVPTRASQIFGASVPPRPLNKTARARMRSWPHQQALELSQQRQQRAFKMTEAQPELITFQSIPTV